MRIEAFNDDFHEGQYCGEGRGEAFIRRRSGAREVEREGGTEGGRGGREGGGSERPFLT